MKKIITIIISVLVLFVVIDLVSIFTRNKAIFAIKDDSVYYGLFYNTYNCDEYPMAQIRFKWSDFGCQEINR